MRRTHVTRSPARRARSYQYSSSPCRTRAGSIVSMGTAIENVVGNVGGATSPARKAGWGSPIASANFRIAPRSTSKVRGSDVAPINERSTAMVGPARLRSAGVDARVRAGHARSLLRDRGSAASTANPDSPSAPANAQNTRSYPPSQAKRSDAPTGPRARAPLAATAMAPPMLP